MKPRLITLRHR